MGTKDIKAMGLWIAWFEKEKGAFKLKFNYIFGKFKLCF
jgi:hypothetical protein